VARCLDECNDHLTCQLDCQVACYPVGEIEGAIAAVQKRASDVTLAMQKRVSSTLYAMLSCRY